MNITKQHFNDDKIKIRTVVGEDISATLLVALRTEGGTAEVTFAPLTEEALAREIREELHAEIEVVRLVDTVQYDYPKFHMDMRCYLCSLISDEVELVEHEAARWLDTDDVWSVKWLPSDVEVIEDLFGGLVCAE